jgi:hypothetical protein
MREKHRFNDHRITYGNESNPRDVRQLLAFAKRTVRDANPVRNETGGYLYDQLNRLKEARAAITFASNTWGTETITDRYENLFTYDANGNILTQKRSDHTGDMFDDLDYGYQKQQMQIGNLLLHRNRLYHVEDYNTISNDAGEITDQGTFDQDPEDINVNNNYVYDELGQLIMDKDPDTDIEEISWRVDGKISRVKRESGSSAVSLEFEYDSFGNRIAKKVYSDNTFSSGSLESITYYLRDNAVLRSGPARP